MTTSSDPKKAQDDPIQSMMGELGRWQIFVCGIVFLLKFPVAWHQMGIIFLAPKVDFTCSDPSLEKCDASCPQHVFNTSVFSNTIQMEWDLVCQRQSLANLSQTVFMLGILVGNMLFGAFADKMGRRVPLVIAVITQLIFGVASSFTTSFWLFVVFRFVTAAATGGTMVTS
jgi:MFS family permease